MIAFSAPTIIVYGLLTAAILSVWLPRSVNQGLRLPLWAALLGVSAGSGFYYGIVEAGGILSLAILGALCCLVQHPAPGRSIRVLAGLGVAGLVSALFLHIVPFFKNPLVFDSVVVGSRAPPYSQHWNFDKAAAGLVLLGFFGDLCRTGRDWKMLARRSYGVVIAAVLLTLPPAWALGYAVPDPSFTPVYFAWAWSNLFFTCAAEEMLFRGYVQKHLTASTANEGHRVAIVVLVGILFGAAHFAGGATYVVLASVAGIGYGYAYHATGRIEAAILTHFVLNSVHFLFFAYPYASGVM